MTDTGTTFITTLNALVPALEKALAGAGNPQDLEEIRVKFLGRKGLLAEKLAKLKDLPPEDKPGAGKAGNAIKKALMDLFEAQEKALLCPDHSTGSSVFDPSMPGRTPAIGSLHPITKVMQEICSVFINLGYEVANGPEIETDWYNFEALNFPPEHPARDMQDTLYISDSIVLRTHTSPLQIRSMLSKKPPLAVIAPGKVYRRDSDVTHTPMFHQIEGILVDHDVSMAHLRGTLTCLVQHLFGTETRVRFRPSFFPFTEPSAEVDISCCMCGGKGEKDGIPCRVCKTTGWLEVLGCGMVHPNVFKSVGYDPKVYTGFAFGLGVERIAMLKYGINDLRMFFDNDIRFLHQFV